MTAAAGVYMLAAVGVLLVVTGLPAWVVLLGVAMTFAGAGLAAGTFAIELMAAIPGRITGLLENDLLQALPLYVLMGALLHHLPLASRLLRTGSYALRRTGAGTPLAGLGLGLLLAPMNGSVGASVAMLGRAVLPRLEDAGMDRGKSAALACAASTLGVVVPPSLVLILLSDALMRAHTEAVNASGVAARIVNTQDLFVGALLPAAMLFLFYAAVAWYANRRPVAEPAGDAPSRAESVVAGGIALFVGGLLVGVTLGYLYAVEAAATGAMALLFAGLVTRTLTRRVLAAVLRDTMAISGALFALLVGATVFTLVVRAFGTDRWIAAALAALPGGAPATMAVVLGGLALCALVLDAFELIFVVIPVVMPPLLVQVPDAAWVGVLTLLILQASFLVPPFGYAVLMLRQQLRQALPTPQLARALAPYIVAQLAVLALVIAFPPLVWHRFDGERGAAVAAPPVSDDEARRMLEQQMQQGAESETADTPEKAARPER